MAMASRFASRAMRTSVKPTLRVQARGMADASLSPEVIAASSTQWFWISAGAVAFVPVASVAIMALEAGHEHSHDEHNYPHLKKLDKKFPWSNGKCELMDLACRAAAK